MKLSIYSHPFSFPASQEPAWANRVERWYQLDAPAFGLTETYWHHREALRDPPAWIFLCSPRASNDTDAHFAQTTTPSPAKFVHTLPNIRSAPLLQVMNWSGPVLCIQKDPNTILTGLNEALEMNERVWVASVAGSWGHIFVLDEMGELKIRKTGSVNMANVASHDKQWLSWILKPEHPFVGQGLTIG